MHNIQDKLTQVNKRIQQAAHNADRNPAEITLLAVSKKKPAEQIVDAFNAGQRDFGENYLQESIEKIQQVNNSEICWHFIGPIQSNKTRQIAENFHWAHTVDRLKIAQRLSDQRPEHLPPINICLQINIDYEESKSGIRTEEAEALALAASELPNLRLRGLMAIPAARNEAPTSTEITQSTSKCPFKRMQELFIRLKKHPQLAKLDTLSMGMSGDLEQAVAAGATIVRVGTAIFGQRT